MQSRARPPWLKTKGCCFRPDAFLYLAVTILHSRTSDGISGHVFVCWRKLSTCVWSQMTQKNGFHMVSPSFNKNLEHANSIYYKSAMWMRQIKWSVRNRKSYSSLPDQKKLARIEGQPNLCLVTVTAHHSIFNPSTAQQCYSVIQGQQSELPSTTVAASLWRSISMRVSPFLTKRSATNLWELMGSNNRCLLDLRDLIGFTVIKGIYSN